VSQPEILPQQRRENPEPSEQMQPVPWLLLVVTALLLLFGIVYIAQADIETPARWGDGRGAAELSGPRKADPAAKVDGAALYASLCAACHQASGQGLPASSRPWRGRSGCWATRRRWPPSCCRASRGR
jgi:mono/diheme cytochrome c family protein